MGKFCIYLKLQLKRVGKVFPVIFFMTLLLGAGLSLLVWMQFKLNREDAGKQKISLGIVGDTEDSYLGFGIYALENIDSSRYTITFVRLEEKEASAQLEKGKISAYIRIPEGFVDSVVSGENMPVEFVSGASQGGIGTELLRELADAVSVLITESQTGIYSMQELYLDYKALETIYEDTDKLNLRYFDVILSRENMYRMVTENERNVCSAAGYYLCAVILVFLMIWGMNGGALLVKNDMSLGKVLSAGGLNVWAQTSGEFAGYVCLMAGNSLGIVLVLVGAAGYFRFSLPEAKELGDMIRFSLGIWPVLLCTASMQFLLYNLVTGLTEGLLLNFVGTVGLGYLSGCFYPISYFPEGVRRLASFLPTGIGMKYLESYLLGQSAADMCLKLLLYTAVFFVLAVWIRKRKLER